MIQSTNRREHLCTLWQVILRTQRHVFCANTRTDLRPYAYTGMCSCTLAGMRLHAHTSECALLHVTEFDPAHTMANPAGIQDNAKQCNVSSVCPSVCATRAAPTGTTACAPASTRQCHAIHARDCIFVQRHVFESSNTTARAPDQQRDASQVLVCGSSHAVR